MRTSKILYLLSFDEFMKLKGFFFLKMNDYAMLSDQFYKSLKINVKIFDKLLTINSTSFFIFSFC